MANCVCTIYTTLAAYKAAVEALDDSKYLGTFTFREQGTRTEKIVLVRKT